MDDAGVLPEDWKTSVANMKGGSSKNPYADMFKLSDTDIDKFTKKTKKTKKKRKTTTKNLDEVLQDDIKSEDSTDK